MEQRKPVAQEFALSLVAHTAALLFRNGQTTERSQEAASRLGAALGIAPTFLVRWGEILTFANGGGSQRYAVLSAVPTNVDMRKVSSATRLVDRIVANEVAPEAIESELTAIEALPSTSTFRFAAFAGLGAAALGVVFGVSHLVTLVLIAFIAGSGAMLRRWLASFTSNPFAQPLAAAMLAGMLGATAIRLGVAPPDAMVALCPCMVLVPGPHFLNGALDLWRARIAVGSARMVFASLIVLMICAGLLAGLSLGGVSLPVTGAFQRIPIGYDVLAAGVAVAAYGTFFNMPWRMLPIPVAIGMLSHAARWAVVYEAGASAEVGALVACLIAGTIVTPVAARLHMPFAALAFASVVSMIPGIFLFRMSSGFVNLIALGTVAPPSLLQNSIVDGATAFFILAAMAFGLILPRIVGEHFFFPLRPSRGAAPAHVDTTAVTDRGKS